LTGAEELFQAVVEDSPIRYEANSRRSKHSGKQRATGTFFFPGEPIPGEFIKRVSLIFDSAGGVPDPSVEQVRLRLNGIEVGQVWDREIGPALVPITWDVLVDLPAIVEQYLIFGRSVTLVRVPRFLKIETLTGNKVFTPLVWWRAALSTGNVRAGQTEFACSSLARECGQGSVSALTVRVSLLFGDGDGTGLDIGGGPLSGRYPLSALHTRVGFTPTQTVAGFPVGTLPDTTGAPSGTCPIGPFSWRRIQVFAGLFGPDLIPIWDKNVATVELIEENRARLPFGTCGRPEPVPVVPSPLPLPEVRLRRDYLPAEQDLFEQFNIIPPEYEITLK
jgi:hypothetical protein